MRIVVLVKPVPDTPGSERLGPDGRLDRAASPAVVNGNDEYALEAALKLIEAADGGEVTLLAMAPDGRARNAAQGARDGRRRAASSSPTRPSPAPDARHDRPGPGRGPAAARVRPGVRRRRHLGRRRRASSAAGVAALLGLPYLSYAAPDRADAERPRPGPPHQSDRLRRARGADAGAGRRDPGPRRAALPVAQGDHGRPLEGDRDAVAGRPRARSGDASAAPSRRRASSAPRRRRPARATRVVRDAARAGRRDVVDFLAERRLI